MFDDPTAVKSSKNFLCCNGLRRLIVDVFKDTLTYMFQIILL